VNRHRSCISGARNAGFRARGNALPEDHMSAFSTYLIGFLVLIIGLAIAASLLGAPTTWIVVGVIVLVGIGIISATSRTKPKDPQPPAV
jgi:hypothetical protein